MEQICRNIDHFLLSVSIIRFACTTRAFTWFSHDHCPLIPLDSIIPLTNTAPRNYRMDGKKHAEEIQADNPDDKADTVPTKDFRAMFQGKRNEIV